MLKPRHAATTRIERGFRRLAHGDVHYRAAGSGPVVLALHESPRSSLSMLPVIDTLAADFRVIAPDTAGYGLSDRLAADAPEMDEFVDVLAALLDSFGVQRAAIYGAHTGAALAVAFAHRHPGRVTSLTLDGLSVFTPSEVEDFRTRYLAPYSPAWDGAHVMGLWSRVKDLFTWFPWYDQSPVARLTHEPPNLEVLSRSFLGFLQAGHDYAKAYIRAAGFDPNTVLPTLQTPTTVMAREDDLIAHHLSRLTESPAVVRWLGPDLSAWQTALGESVAKGDSPDTATALDNGDQGSCFLPIGDGWLHVLQAGPAEGPVHVLLPGLPGDAVDLVARVQILKPGSRLIAISLPGCGWSDPLAGAGGLDAVLDVLDAAVGQLGVSVETLVAEGASGLVAALWAERLDAASILTLDAPAWLVGEAPLSAAAPLAPLPPRWDGAHLTGAWFQLRDLALYDTPPGLGSIARRAAGEVLDVERLDRVFRSYVEGPDCAAVLGDVVAELARRPELSAIVARSRQG